MFITFAGHFRPEEGRTLFPSPPRGPNERDQICIESCITKPFYANSSWPTWPDVALADARRGARAEGVFFHTPEGKRYYDLVSGVSVNNVGHANPAVVEAVRRQAADYMHVMVYGELVERPQVEFAHRLSEALPAPLESVYFVNSGAEASGGR